MKIVSINVGRPREIQWRGEPVRTSIFKTAVEGSIAVRALNLEGDEQSDLSVHGGADKAVYAYPSEHYEYWHDELADADLPWGAFGENLTTVGLSETDLRIGDRLSIGSAEFRITQPRVPCYKLNARHDRPDMVKLFLRAGRPGFYLAVDREGTITEGDTVEHRPVTGPAMTVAEVARLYAVENPEPELLKTASEQAGLPEGWREHFRARLARHA